MDRKRSIELLNDAARDELQAVHQYMYFHFHLDDQGFGPLAALFKRIAIEEMGHVERAAERILFLNGDVEMEPKGSVEPIRDPEAMVAKAAEMEWEAVKDYNKAAQECSANADAASRQIFESLISDEERHYDLFDQQLENIKRFGHNYLALQSFGRAEPGAPEAD
jgi:bacterioferritin